jgi:hypothetical protein
MEVNKGCIKYHSGPKTVCLYTVTTSLFTKSISKSRYCQTSLNSAKIVFYLKQPFRGIFLVVHVLAISF